MAFFIFWITIDSDFIGCCMWELSRVLQIDYFEHMIEKVSEGGFNIHPI